MNKQQFTDTMLLLDEELRGEIDKSLKDLILRYRDSITHRLIAGNVVRGELNEMVEELIKITGEISERYLLKNLQEVDDLLKINPTKFNEYMEIGQSVGLAYCIRYHLQHRKAYEKVAHDKALKGDHKFFQYCTSFYNKKAERKRGPGRQPSPKKEVDVPSFESASKLNKS